MDGYVNVLKPPGWSSHDLVGLLRRLTGERRIGHAGTLDPAAAGVLPIAVGRRATRTISSAIWDQKMYWAEVELGSSTTTDDAEGEVIATGDPSFLDEDRILAALERFVGEISQRPPAYSAVHVDGQRSYRSARKGMPKELPSRTVRVDAVALLGWQNPRLQLAIQCHSGTYIRSIARDLGEALHCPAHLHGLVRTRVGPFGINTALDPGMLESIFAAGGGERIMWPIDMVAEDRPALIVAPSHALDFENGRPWPIAPGSLEPPGVVRVYDTEGTFLGLARASDAHWLPVRAPTSPSPGG